MTFEPNIGPIGPSRLRKLLTGSVKEFLDFEYGGTPTYAMNEGILFENLTLKEDYKLEDNFEAVDEIIDPSPNVKAVLDDLFMQGVLNVEDNKDKLQKAAHSVGYLLKAKDADSVYKSIMDLYSGKAYWNQLLKGKERPLLLKKDIEIIKQASTIARKELDTLYKRVKELGHTFEIKLFKEYTTSYTINYGGDTYVFTLTFHPDLVIEFSNQNICPLIVDLKYTSMFPITAFRKFRYDLPMTFYREFIPGSAANEYWPPLLLFGKKYDPNGTAMYPMLPNVRDIAFNGAEIMEQVAKLGTISGRRIIGIKDLFEHICYMAKHNHWDINFYDRYYRTNGLSIL